MKLNYEKCFYSLECNENTILVRVFNAHEFKGYFVQKKTHRKCRKDKRVKANDKKKEQEKVCHRLYFNVFFMFLYASYLTMVSYLYADCNKAQGCVKIIMISRMTYYLRYY